MSKADFLANELDYVKHEFNGQKCFIREMDAHEFAYIHDVVKQTFKEGMQNELVLDVVFKALVVCITLYDESKSRVFDSESQEDIESVARVKHSTLNDAYKKAMRISGLHGFIGEKPPKKT